MAEELGILITIGLPSAHVPLVWERMCLGTHVCNVIETEPVW